MSNTRDGVLLVGRGTLRFGSPDLNLLRELSEKVPKAPEPEIIKPEPQADEYDLAIDSVVNNIGKVRVHGLPSPVMEAYMPIDNFYKHPSTDILRRGHVGPPVMELHPTGEEFSKVAEAAREQELPSLAHTWELARTGIEHELTGTQYSHQMFNLLEMEANSSGEAIPQDLFETFQDIFDRYTVEVVAAIARGNLDHAGRALLSVERYAERSELIDQEVFHALKVFYSRAMIDQGLAGAVHLSALEELLEFEWACGKTRIPFGLPQAIKEEYDAFVLDVFKAVAKGDLEYAGAAINRIAPYVAGSGNLDKSIFLELNSLYVKALQRTEDYNELQRLMLDMEDAQVLAGSVSEYLEGSDDEKE